MTKTIIFFGAGASFGSDIKDTPPLTADLYNKLRDYEIDVWSKIPTEIAEYFIPDFENGMAILSEKKPHLIPKLQRSMASYFFKFKPRSSNLYRKLSKLIYSTNWHGVLSTINYDRLLSLSLQQERINAKIGNSDIKKNEIELILPHGCCNIFCESVKGKSNNISFNGIAVQTRGEITIIDNVEEFEYRIKNDALPPVMSYIEPNKRATSGVNFIENQQYKYREYVLHARTICIIGIKIRPRDEHIWRPLAKTNGKLLYCSGRDSGNEFSEWGKNNRNNIQDKIYHGNFSEYFEEICKDLEIS